MNNVYAAAIFCLAFVMVWLGRPAHGEEAIPLFKKSWMLGQFYVLATMIVSVAGVAVFLA